MSVKDNRMKCDWCGKPTSEQDRAKVVFQKKSGEESWHLEAHRGECLANLMMTLANSEVGAGEVKED
jgi:glutamine synthetase type III